MLLTGCLSIAALAAAPAAGGATASFIVYRCGDRHSASERDNLCRVDADGRGHRRLTRDGHAGTGAYSEPSLSRDGTRLAFTFNYQLHTSKLPPRRRRPLGGTSVQDVSMSPDGRRIAFIDYDSLDEHNPYDHWSLFTVGFGGEHRSRRRSLPRAADWLFGRPLVETADARRGRPLCQLAATGTRCSRVIHPNLRGRLTDPAVAPGGKRMAVRVDSTGIALYGLPRGRFLRYLVADNVAEGPTWSPDGEAVAYSSAGIVKVVNARRRPFSQGVASGDMPTWGGRAGHRRARFRILRVRMRGRRLSVRARIAGSARARLIVRFGHDLGWQRMFRPRPRGGHVRVTARVRGDQLFGCFIVATYPGDARHRRVTLFSRVRGGVCEGAGRY